MVKNTAGKASSSATRSSVSKLPSRRKRAVSSDENEDKSSSEEELSSRVAKRSHKIAKRDDEDEDEDEDEDASKRASQKRKTAKAKSTAKVDDEQDTSVKVNEQGERFIELGKKRRATLRNFKGTVFLDIREFYGDDNDLKPGRKGVSLQLAQWNNLRNSADDIDQLFAQMK